MYGYQIRLESGDVCNRPRTLITINLIVWVPRGAFTHISNAVLIIWLRVIKLDVYDNAPSITFHAIERTIRAWPQSMPLLRDDGASERWVI